VLTVLAGYVTALLLLLLLLFLRPTSRATEKSSE
jgi:hypothetical protein